ncbi:MAG: C10 family peptidase [bacterium]
MKKHLSYFLFLLLISHFSLSHAKPVDLSTAQRAAENLLQKTVVDATPVQFTECYLFLGVDGQGFALLAADDCVRPILGYSLIGSFPPEELPRHVLDWIEGRQHDISKAKSHGGSRHSDWDRLLQGSMKSSGQSVSPMITSTWDQSYPYNILCPYDSVEDHDTYVGCVAIATAQVMRYWGHPAQGRGSHSYSTPYGTLSADFAATPYQWDSMPNVLTATLSPAEINAVAQLCHQVGVAVEMDYSTSGSNAFVGFIGDIFQWTAERALKTFFRYNPTLYAAFRNRHSGDEWDSLCRSQLAGGMPLIYAGFGPMGGHAYIVDGYDSLGFFHVNWGWGGFYDGYFTLDSLDTGGGYSFSLNCQALMNVYPITIDSPRAYIYGVSADTAQGTVQGGGVYFTDSMKVVLLATANDGYRFDRWTSGNFNNPIVTSPTRDFNDTAIFVPLNPDTLGYSRGDLIDGSAFDTSSVAEWGIRIPASYFGFRKQIEEVQMHAYDTGLYHLAVYRGESPVTPLRTCDVMVTDRGWQTFVLDAPLPLYDTLPLWITFRTDGIECPIAQSTYSGHDDGSWIKIGDAWMTLQGGSAPYYASWPIRAALTPMDRVHLSVMPDDIVKGDITGGGNYYPGDSVELVAIPHTGYRFVEWSTSSTDNPYHFIIECDTLVVAYFAGLDNIDNIETSVFTATVNGLTLTVDNPQGHAVSVYDIQGRHIYTITQPCNHTITLPAPGVYILRSGGTVEKIIAKP